jgi:hypothetical protein
MNDIFILKTKKNTFTYYLLNDKIYETNVSYNYNRNYYYNNKDLWINYKSKYKKQKYISFKKPKLNNDIFLIKFD